jgi:hypothetical protein
MITEITTIINETITTVSVNLYAADPNTKQVCASCTHNNNGTCQRRSQVWTCATYPKVVPFYPRATSMACSSFTVRYLGEEWPEL